VHTYASFGMVRDIVANVTDRGRVSALFVLADAPRVSGDTDLAHSFIQAAAGQQLFEVHQDIAAVFSMNGDLDPAERARDR
jgi:hypothetical protein